MNGNMESGSGNTDLPLATREQISRWLDGDIASHEIELAMTTLAGAKGFISRWNMRARTGMGAPSGRPRRSTGWTNRGSMPRGRRTPQRPPRPAYSQSRKTVPGPSGLGPNAVTRTPSSSSVRTGP